MTRLGQRFLDHEGLVLGQCGYKHEDYRVDLSQEIFTFYH